MSFEQYRHDARHAVIDTAQAFHLNAITNEGRQLEVPCSYQILEPGFRPFRAGKATAEELQAELDDNLAQAAVRKIDPGIEGYESVRKICLQLGLGIDCSNFAYRAQTLLHGIVNGEPYVNHVFRDGKEISSLHATKDSWTAKDEHGHPRELTEEERAKLDTNDPVSIAWIASVFGKDPEFVMGSHHMTTQEAAVPIEATEALPGDLLAFKKAGNGVVSHVAVVESVEASADHVRLDFWHSWHTRDIKSGLRRDSVQYGDLNPTWSHEGLADTERYQGHYICRPIGLVAIVKTLTK